MIMTDAEKADKAQGDQPRYARKQYLSMKQELNMLHYSYQTLPSPSPKSKIQVGSSSDPQLMYS